jgi:circadian clock protein KaiB
MDKFVLKLYVTGTTPNSARAIANLQRLATEELSEKYEVVVIDVLQNPQLAENEKILATPTLVKTLPPPLRRVIGDLADTGKVLIGLDLRPGAPSMNEGDSQ